MRGSRSGRQECLLAFDQAHVARPGPLGGVLDLEIHPLAFAQELEDSATDGTAMKEMFDTTFIANKAEAFIDEKASDSTRRHTRVLPKRPPGISQGGHQAIGDLDRRRVATREGGADLPTIRRVNCEAATLSLENAPSVGSSPYEVKKRQELAAAV